MKKWIVVACLLFAVQSFAQYGDFMYLVTPGQVEKNQWRTKYESAYALRAVQPFGEDGLEQRLGGVYGFSDNLNLSAVATTIFEKDDDNAISSAQVELMYDFYNLKKYGLSFSVGGAWIREFQAVQTAQTRLAASWVRGKWGTAANFVLQKPFADDRDAVDILFSMGTNMQLSKRFHLGVEFVSEDIEGFFEEEEAEGGAKLLLSPNIKMLTESMQIRLGAGPIFYLTESDQSSMAPRVLPTVPDKNGWMVRLSAIYNI